jgi:hypothetical protein
MSTSQVNCKNCEQPFDEGFEFCPHCGQKVNDELTIGVLFYNTISNYFSFDARFLKSFIPLLFRPGYLAKEFIKGKRLLYLHPAQMYLFISVVFFFIFSFTVREQEETLNKEFKKATEKIDLTMIDSVAVREQDSLTRIEIRETLEKNKFLTGMTDNAIDSIVNMDVIPKKNDISIGFNEDKIDSLLKANAPDKDIYKIMGLEEDDGWIWRKLYAQALKFYKARDAGNIVSAFYDTVPIALFFVLPIFAFILKLFYFRRGRFAHHLVFSFYYFSFVFTVLSIIFGINLIYEIPDSIDFLIALSCFMYFFIALKRFYDQGWFLSCVKACFSVLVFIPFLLITAFVILGFAFMFY